MEGDDPSPGMNLFHADIRRMIGALDVIYEDENEVNMITRSQSKKVTFIPTLEQVHPQVPHRLSKDSPKATIGGIYDAVQMMHAGSTGAYGNDPNAGLLVVSTFSLSSVD